VTVACTNSVTPSAYNRRCGGSRINPQRQLQVGAVRVCWIAIFPAFLVRPEWRGLFVCGGGVTGIAVFIDYQNVYMRAWTCFGDRHDPPAMGQIVPLRAAALLTERGSHIDPAFTLSSVHIFRGHPSSEHSPVGHAAAQRQIQTWRTQPLVSVTTRPLHYYRRGAGRTGASSLDAREKGIDVLLAVDLVLGAERDNFDVAILFSSDTDLIPALDAVRTIGKRCELAAWRPPRGHGMRLRMPGVWCHWLDDNDYASLHDPADYTKHRESR
jgi:uncharacterized LabA/DUF88 family protein